MLITAFYFDSYLKCTTKCWLYSQGKNGSGNVYSEWIRSRNEQYRKEGIIRLLDGATAIHTIGIFIVAFALNVFLANTQKRG